MKLSTISHLRRETSGKECGWWVIDELDQFILWYIHILLHKRRWTSKLGILYCFCVHSSWTSAIKCFWHLQGVCNNYAFINPENQWEVIKPCNLRHLFHRSILIFHHIPQVCWWIRPIFSQVLKFCQDGNRLLTGDEACISFHCSNKKKCSTVLAKGATHGKSQFLG